MARTKSSARKLSVPVVRPRTDFTPDLLKLLPSIDELQILYNYLVPKSVFVEDRGRPTELFELLFFTCCWIAQYECTDLPNSSNKLFNLDRMAEGATSAVTSGDLYQSIRDICIDLDGKISKPREVPMIMSMRAFLFYRRLMSNLRMNLENKPSVVMRALNRYVPMLFVDGVFYWDHVVQNGETLQEKRTFNISTQRILQDCCEHEICFHDDHSRVVSPTKDAVEVAAAFASLAHVNPDAQAVCPKCHVLQTASASCTACAAPLEESPPCTPLYAEKPGTCIGGSHFVTGDNNPISKRRKIALE